jgi:arginine-tRNA-protein transferase
VRLLKQYYQQQLVAVTIVDETAAAFSAVYTFYEPNASQFSPGILAVLHLLEQSAKQQKDWLYLGYQIDDCKKMAYKAAFLPQQRFIKGQWHSFG